MSKNLHYQSNWKTFLPRNGLGANVDLNSLKFLTSQHVLNGQTQFQSEKQQKHNDYLNARSGFGYFFSSRQLGHSTNADKTSKETLLYPTMESLFLGFWIKHRVGRKLSRKKIVKMYIPNKLNLIWIYFKSHKERNWLQIFGVDLTIGKLATISRSRSNLHNE